jgi:NAD(P)-dependent dehydrogenase (short-subunit alcohol dehydrogenase family)
MTNVGQFCDRVVVITGGASGMGAASAREFARRQATLLLVDLDGPGAEAVAKQCRELGAPAVDVEIGDVSSSAFCHRAIESALGRFGSVDVLVTAAGTIHRADALGTDDADWRRVLGVNVDGTFFACRAALAVMTEARSGAIVTFGSIWGGVGSAGSTAYCVSKGAVHQLTRALALDHVEQGIRVNAVAPGEVDTPMLASQRDEPPTPEYLQALADATIPMKRLAQPDEIAKVVVFLASDDASYLTGEVVHIDGGYTAR